MDSSSQEVFCPKGEGTKCICKDCRNCYGGLGFGSAYTCQRVNKAPWEDSGVSRTPWSRTEQTIPQVCLQNRLSISILSCTKCLSNLSR